MPTVIPIVTPKIVVVHESSGRSRAVLQLERTIPKVPPNSKPLPNERICQICGSPQKLKICRKITSKFDKVFLLLSAFYQKRIDSADAKKLYECKDFFVCRSHFPNAIQTILKALGINYPQNIWLSDFSKVHEISKQVEMITGKRISDQKFREAAYGFIDDYTPKKRETYVTQFHKMEDPVIITMEDDEPANVPEPLKIVPKSCREPRKQVLESTEDEHQKTIKIIEQQVFQPPPTFFEPPTFKYFGCPIECRLCQRVNEKNTMIKVPNWLRHRLQHNGNDFMCRQHFEKNAFSCKGRLLKGAMPTCYSSTTTTTVLNIDEI